MQSFTEGTGLEGRVSQQICDRCAMKLTMPGVRNDAGVFCCHGCASPAIHGRLLQPNTSRSLEVRRAVRIDAPATEVAKFLSRVELLHLYEQKLTRLQVTGVSKDGSTACATADGQFGVLTYHIELHFKASGGGGYESTLCSKGPIRGLRGDFSVAAHADGGSVVTHFERYEFFGGAAARYLFELAVPYLGWSIARELRTLKRLVEDPAALGEALREGDPRRIPVDPGVLVWDPTRTSSGSRGLTRRALRPQTAAAAAAFAAGAVAGALAMALAKRRR